MNHGEQQCRGRRILKTLRLYPLKLAPRIALIHYSTHPADIAVALFALRLVATFFAPQANNSQYVCGSALDCLIARQCSCGLFRSWPWLMH